MLLAQALDIVKQAKVATILGDSDRRKPSTGKDKTSRRGSRESLDMTYDGEDVSITQTVCVIMYLVIIFEYLHSFELFSLLLPFVGIVYICVKEIRLLVSRKIKADCKFVY